MAKLKRHPKHIRFVYKANQTKVNLSSYFDQVWSETQFFSLPLKRQLAGSTRQIDTGQILDLPNFHWTATLSIKSEQCVGDHTGLGVTSYDPQIVAGG